MPSSHAAGRPAAVSRKANIPLSHRQLVAIPLLHICFRFQVEG